MKLTRFHRSFFGVWLLMAAQVASAQLPQVVDGTSLPSLAPMLKRVMPAVVNISTKSEIEVADNPLLRDPFFRHFFELPENLPRKRQTSSLGSGVIVDAHNGYVLTNHHVIDKADEIQVTLQDGRRLSAKLIGQDAASDIALIKIAGNSLTEIPLGNSDVVEVGDFVVAIGNPFGLGQTATSGIVSALGRSGLGIEGYEDFIQTDASINPGNSGGALVNLRGELVGINTAILAPSGGNIGIGFAIPSNMVAKIEESLLKHGKVRRGLLGVTIQDLTPELAQAFNLDVRRGAVITKVQPQSPAAKAGLTAGDLVLSVNGRPVRSSSDLRNFIGLLEIGDKVTLEVIHAGRRDVRTAYVAQPIYQKSDGEEIHPVFVGTSLADSGQNPSTREPEGVRIEDVSPSSYAKRVGLLAGDVIVSVNRQRIHNLAELKAVARRSRELLLNVQRGNDGFFVLMR